MLKKLLLLLSARPEPRSLCPGWRLQLVWHYRHQQETATIWWLRRPNGTRHAIIGYRSNRLVQYYDVEHELSPMRN